MKNKKGFTLVELLVVIAIIAVLSALGLVGVSGAQRQGRDTTRRNDLNQYRVALENYYTASSKYVTSATAAVASTALSTDLASYMTDFPVDPKASGACDFATTATTYNYCYRTNATGTEFVLGTKLETGKCYFMCGINNATRGGKSGTIACVDMPDTCPAI